MPEIISSPPLVALSGNPILFEVQSGDYLANPGVKACLYLIFASPGEGGDTFTLNWGGRSLTFTCSPSPDDSGEQIPDNTVVANLNDWVAAIAPYIRSNYLVSEDFEVSVNLNELFFNAREYGSNLTMTASWQWTGVVPSPAGICVKGNLATVAQVRKHEFGRAIDVKVSGMSPDEIRKDITQKYHLFRDVGLTTLEAATPTWVHLDYRYTLSEKPLIFK